MKLLLDENRSRRLVPALQACFPGTSQVALLEPERLVAARGYRSRLAHVALGNEPKERLLAALLAAADGIAAARLDTKVGVGAGEARAPQRQGPRLIAHRRQVLTFKT